jgi:3-isopropylmalate dehydrogenase
MRRGPGPAASPAQELGLFANLRPAVCYPALAGLSLKREVVEGLDIMIVRGTGGVYFGEPKTITDLGNGRSAPSTRGHDTGDRAHPLAFDLAASAATS